MVAPTVVGSQEKVTDPETGLTVVVRKPIASQVDVAVRRAIRYAALRTKANRDKKVAIVFYNYPAGKANIGASYLNVAESITNILERLAKEGYDVAGRAAVSAADDVLKDITEKARNVGGYAPGELEEMLVDRATRSGSGSPSTRSGSGIRAGLRAKLLKDWGAPEKSQLMTVSPANGPSLRHPGRAIRQHHAAAAAGARLGRGREKMYHAKDLAPHHQYVAAYAWLRNGFKADAVVHVGTHGTLEWLDGKDIGPVARRCAGRADRGHARISTSTTSTSSAKGWSRGAAAWRRSSITWCRRSRRAGCTRSSPSWARRSATSTRRQNDNPELAQAYLERIREQVIALGIAKDLALEAREAGQRRRRRRSTRSRTT